MLYSYKGDMEKALDYLSIVIDDSEQQLRTDIFCYARLIHLMCHYNLNNFNLVINLLPSVKMTFENNRQMNPVIDLMLAFLRRGSRATNFGLSEYISATVGKLQQYEKGGMERIAFIYYDLTSWVKSIGTGTTIESIRKEIE